MSTGFYKIMKKSLPNRSACPINFSLESFGDSWSLLILRDIIQFGKKTYGEFINSEEGIARNILADRLVKLQEEGILVKRPHPVDKRKDIYKVTDKGLGLVPLLLDMSEWGSQFGTPPDPLLATWLAFVRENRAAVIANVQQAVREGRSMFRGPDCVAAQMLNM
jgi:DNA-binding HxlR family transcriptional regulator